MTRSVFDRLRRLAANLQSLQRRNCRGRLGNFWAICLCQDPSPSDKWLGSRVGRILVENPSGLKRYLKRALPTVMLAGAAILIVFGVSGRALMAQPGNPQGAGFLGTWCPQGDPSKHASISNNGAFFNLTNENGDNSIGNLQASNQINAPAWQFVTGTLSSDGRRINWSNGTFWARCAVDGGGDKHNRTNLNGIWYPQGNRSSQCSILQHRGVLSLQNEQGEQATGSLDGKHHISTKWSGKRIDGTISDSGNRIDWDNGSYWVRYRVY